jgi:hypothetical protein
MVSHLFFYQLMLVALVWLCVMLHGAWPSAPAAVCPTTPEPPGPRPKRHHEPTPFAGLTTKPPCDACEHRGDPRPQAPCAAPPRMVMTRGRRRQVDTSTHFCPNADCTYWGWGGWGNLRANGPPNGGPWRQWFCLAWRRYFLESLGTICPGKCAAVDLIVRGIACLAEGLGIRGTARGCEGEAQTVLQWRVDAAEPLRAFSQHFLYDVRVRQVPLDALCALLGAVQDGKVSEAEASERLERSPQWVGGALAPESKLLLAIDVGNRPLALAQCLVHHVAQVLAPDCAPRLLTDGLREYLTALRTPSGQWVQPPRRQAQGPAPKPRWRPLPQRLYAPVVKTVRRRRRVDVQHRVVVGSREALAPLLAPLGWHINTAFVERSNRTIRQHVAAGGRRVSTRCKGEDGLRQQVAVCHCSDNFCLPHASLRQPLPQPEPTHGPGSATRWRPCTPALGAGLTDHVWTLREVLLFRVPPWPQPAGL